MLGGEEKGLYSISSKLRDNNLCSCTNTELASHSIPALGMSLTHQFSFIYKFIVSLKIFKSLCLLQLYLSLEDSQA